MRDSVRQGIMGAPIAAAALAIVGIVWLASLGNIQVPMSDVSNTVSNTASYASSEDVQGSEGAATQDETSSNEASERTAAPIIEDAGESANASASSPASDPTGVVAYTPSYASFDTIANAETPTTFTLVPGGNNAPAMSAEQQQKLSDAVSALTGDDYDLSFALVNLNTGAGCTYNADTSVYGASSIKAPFLSYVCQRLVDTGELDLDDVRYNGESAIIYSDNSAYRSLRVTGGGYYGNTGFIQWLSEMNISDDVAEDTAFPRYCARDGLKMWLSTYNYLSTANTETSAWLSDLLTQTDTSFIRESLQYGDGQYGSEMEGCDTGGSYVEGSPIVVRNKAGWIASGGRFNALADGGIIEANGCTYLAMFMTSAPDGDEYRCRLEDVIRAVWNVAGPVSYATEGEATSADASTTQTAAASEGAEN